MGCLSHPLMQYYPYCERGVTAIGSLLTAKTMGSRTLIVIFAPEGALRSHEQTINDVDIGLAGSTYFRYRYRKHTRI